MGVDVAHGWWWRRVHGLAIYVGSCICFPALFLLRATSLFGFGGVSVGVGLGVVVGVCVVRVVGLVCGAGVSIGGLDGTEVLPSTVWFRHQRAVLKVEGKV